jgi:hypothetical protein
MSIHHGKDGAIYMQVAPGTSKLVAHISTFTLDQTMATVDVTAMSDLNHVYVTGLKDVKGTLSGFWDDTDDSIFNAIDSPTGVLLALYPDFKLFPAKWFGGPAWLSGAIKSGVTAAVVIDATFVAAGSWTRQ